MQIDNLVTQIQSLANGKKASPFVPIKREYRYILIALIILQLLIELIEFLNSESEATSWAALGALTQSILLYLPVFFYRRSYGWFHPLVFIPLYTFAFSLPTFVPKVITLLWEGPSAILYEPTTNVALGNWGRESLTWLNAKAAYVTIVSLIAYYLGFFLFPPLKIPRLRLKPISYPGLKTAIAVGFSLAIFIIFLERYGGLTGHLVANWQGGRHSNLAGQYYWAFLVNFSLVACLIWLGIDPNVFQKPLFWSCTLTSMLMRFLFTGSRSGIFFMLMIGVMIWMLRKGRFSLTKVISLMLVVIIGIGVLGTFRNVVRDEGVADLSTLTDIQAGIVQALGNSEEAGELTGARNGGPLPMLAYVPEREEYLRGSTYLAALTIPIPRAIWPEKPGLCGGRAAKTFYYENADWGIPCGSIGESYWNFGLPGVIVAFLLYGYFHKCLAQSFRSYQGKSTALVLYALILFYIRPDSTALIKLMQLLVQATILLYLWGGISLFSRRRVKF